MRSSSRPVALAPDVVNVVLFQVTYVASNCGLCTYAVRTISNIVLNTSLFSFLPCRRLKHPRHWRLPGV